MERSLDQIPQDICMISRYVKNFDAHRCWGITNASDEVKESIADL
ncbi:hypothetical protein [Mycobacterium leprae]|nr:hypothetical protein [Mycobacterium leprae]